MKTKIAVCCLELWGEFKKLNLLMKSGITIFLFIFLEVWTFPMWKQYLLAVSKYNEDTLSSLIILPPFLIAMIFLIIGFKKIGDELEKDSENYLQERFKKLWSRLGAKGNAAVTFNYIAGYYKDEHRSRCYNLEFVKGCLEELDSVWGYTENPDAIELAIYLAKTIQYHENDDNIVQSIDIAGEIMSEAELPNKLLISVQGLIRITSHSFYLSQIDSKLMADIEWAIYGKDYETYVQYEENLRLEHDFMDAQAYVTKRIKSLSALANRTFIYASQHFTDKYENQARKNIKKYLIVLRLERLKSEKVNN